MFLIDLSHTSHTRALTGIQRVSRSLLREMQKQGGAEGITWDPYAQQWRRLEEWEVENLALKTVAAKRGASWPLKAKMLGTLRRWGKGGADLKGTQLVPEEARGNGLIVPELFSPSVGRALPRLIQSSRSPAVALFHDAIALKLPEFTPSGTVARMPGYLLELAQFDGVAAISEDSRRCLLDYWEWAGVRDTPPVKAIPLGVDAPSLQTKPSVPRASGEKPTVLCVCSIEGRKNHAALIAAAEQLWAGGLDFQLRLVGLAKRDTAGAVLDRISSLIASGKPLRQDGAVSEEELENAYADCAFTVYPSLMEGFGLPVIESLIRGRPCVCASTGALGEVSSGGGCLTLGHCDAHSLAEALRRLLTQPELLASLSREALQRKSRGWDAHAGELAEWCRTLPLRAGRGIVPRSLG